jgi:hypothetical protein
MRPSETYPGSILLAPFLVTAILSIGSIRKLKISAVQSYPISD